MIALLRGPVLRREANRCIVDVQGVGYEVFAPSRALDAWAATEMTPEVHVSTHVREDAITLYGFETELERQVFQLLTTVSGVGPKVALAALDALTAPELSRAVEAGDITTLNRIKGVGKKTAQRLAIDLKGKLPAGFAPVQPATAKRAPSSPATLDLALQRLGYTKAEIDRVHQALPEHGIDADAPVADLLRAALKILYGGRDR